MKIKHSKEFTIGLSVIIALLVVYFGIEYLKGNNIFKPANYYYATFTDVAGLSQSAPVTLNGYKVGIVRDVTYECDNPGHIKVEMSLDKELRLPVDSKAFLSTDMLGTSSIVLHIGTDKTFYKVGETIKDEQASGLMSSVTNDILPTVGQIMPKIDSLITSLNTLVSDPALAASLAHLKVAMENIEAGSARLNKAMVALPTMANDAGATLTNIKEISGNLSVIASDLTAVSGQLKEMPLEATMANIGQTSESLKELMAKLNSDKSSLGMLVNDPQLYNNLNNASASLDSLLRDVKKNPKRYISIKLL